MVDKGFVNCDLLGPPLETQPGTMAFKGAHGVLFVKEGPRASSTPGKTGPGAGKVTKIAGQGQGEHHSS